MAEYRITGFQRGEVSPLFYGQLDSQDYMVSSKEVTNFLIMQSGALIKRPGTRKSGACRYDDRDVRIEAITVGGQGFLVEIADNMFRFHKDGQVVETGGSPFELGSPYPQSIIHDLEIVRFKEEMHIAHKNVVIRVLRKTGAGDADWELGTPDFYPYKSADGHIPPAITTTTRLDGSKEYAYKHFQFRKSDVGQKMYIKTTSGKVGTFTIDKVVLTQDVAKEVEDPDDPAKKITTHIVQPDNYSEVTYTAGTGGAILDTDVISEWGIHFLNPFELKAGAIAAIDGRFIFGNINDDGTEEGLRIIGTTSIIGYEFRQGYNYDNAYDFTIKENYGREITWITGDTAVIIGTDNGIYTPANLEPITPAGAFTLIRQTSHQAVQREPELAGNSVLFIQRPGTAIRNVIFDYQTQKFQSQNLSESAEHLFRGGVKQIAYQQSPYEILWAATNDGDLCAMTIFRGQDERQMVGGWSRMKFDGDVYDVCVVQSEGGHDEVYIAIQRNTSLGPRMYIERLQFFRLDHWEDAWYVDNGQEYTGVAQNFIDIDPTIPNGTMLTVFVDTGSYGQVEVIDNKITLDAPYTTIRAGWPYESKLHTLMIPAAINQKKRTFRAGVYLFESTSATISPNGGEESLMIMDDDIVLDEPVDLWTGVKTVNLAPQKDKYAEVVIKSTQPTALNIMAISLDLGV